MQSSVSTNFKSFSSSEIEEKIIELNIYDIVEIGSVGWFKQHGILQKLNVQAHFEVSNKKTEIVKDFLVKHNKIPVLIHELVCIEFWKAKLLPLIIPKITNSPSFTQYLLEYHELVLVNLLQTTLFHKEATTTCEESALDLVEYCFRKLNWLNLKKYKTEEKSTELNICLNVISIVRCIADNIETLPLSVESQLFETNDIISCLIELFQHCPWKEESVKASEKPASSLGCFSSEAQTFLALCSLLLSPHGSLSRDQWVTRHVSPSPHLQQRITWLSQQILSRDPIQDQIPHTKNLAEAFQKIVFAATTTTATATSSFQQHLPKKQIVILQHLPQIITLLTNRINNQKNTQNSINLAELVEKQAQTIKSKESLQAQVQELSSFYLGAFGESQPELLKQKQDPCCAKCHQEENEKTQLQRCSRCKNIFYCSRDCQVQDWPLHKRSCHTS